MSDSALPATPLARLELIGFRRVGTWTSKDGCLECQLSEHGGSANVLYAFVANEEILYVGKTVQPLRMRMRGYERPASTQSTNVRSNAKLIELLRVGRSVDVLALPDNGLLRYGGFHVNLAAGLEDSIVSELRPSWNITGIP
jgi:hypothetical protein